MTRAQQFIVNLILRTRVSPFVPASTGCTAFIRWLGEEGFPARELLG